MIRILVGVSFGWLVGVGAWFALGPVFAAPVWRRRNYRDAELSTASGVCIVVAVFAAWATVAVLGRIVDVTSSANPADWFVLLPQTAALAAGFGVLGLLDDIAGVGESGGFRGHLNAMREGRLTTGGLKLVAGPLVALGVVGSFDLDGGLIALLRDGAVVALSANLMNLFDRAPGRVIKVSALWYLLLLLVGTVWVWSPLVMAPPGIVLGAALGLAGPDLREESMLGDVGSNLLGAVLGFATIGLLRPVATWAVLFGLIVLNAVSERVSFSRVIDSVAPLRAIDRWGSLR